MGISRRGEHVVARDFLNRPLERVLWGIGERCAYICSDEQFEDLTKGDFEYPAIGFPINDVYKYNSLSIEH